MGFFDRFKNEAPASPDALTREGVARVRAVPGVEAVEVVDADTLAVTWRGVTGPSRLSLSGIRGPWSDARGFDRIEVMDEFIATVSPPVAGADLPGVALAEPDDALGAERPTSSSPDAPPGGTWETVRHRLRPVVAHPADTDTDTVRWSIGEVLEATVVIDDPAAIPVGRAELADWGVDHATVRAAAESNQAEIDPALDRIAPGEPAWVPTRPEGHLAGWLCAPERLLDATGLTEAVVLVPLPTELVMVDPAAAELVESILASTRTIVEQEPRPLWPAPLLVRSDGVEAWAPGPDHPCARLVEDMRRLAPGPRGS